MGRAPGRRACRRHYAREPHDGRRSCCCTSSHPSRCRSGRSRGGRLVVGVVASWRRCVGRFGGPAVLRAGDVAVVEGAGCRAGSRWAGRVRGKKLPPTPFTVFCLRSNVGVGLTADLLPEHTEERISRCWGGCQGISSPADRAWSYQGLNRFFRLVQPLSKGTRLKSVESWGNLDARCIGHGVSPPSVSGLTK